MQIKALITLAALFLSTPFAYGSDYICKAEPNLDVGLTEYLQVAITPAEVGGLLLMRGKMVGKVTSVSTLSKNISVEEGAFWQTLGMFSFEPLSGLNETTLQNVTTITIYQVNNASGAEIYVYQFFSGTRQIGGTFYVNGAATVCNP